MGKRFELTGTESERSELEQLSRSSKRQESDRGRAVLWCLEGRTRAEVGRRLGTSGQQVSRWCGQYRRGGVEALRAKVRPGRTPMKARVALPAVEEILSEPAPEGVVWTVARLAEEVGRRTGVRISESWLSVVMRKKGVLPGNARGTRSRAGKIWMKSNDRA